MVDEIFTGEIFLGHRAIPIVLVSDMAMEIDLPGNDGFPGQVYVFGAGRNLYLASAAHAREDIALNDECGIVNWSAAVAADQPRAFEDDCGRPAALCIQLKETCCRHNARNKNDYVFHR